MALRPEVIDAFNVLGVPPDADEATASREYKRLALRHHPDRNHGDSTSTARFQEISAAWDICTRHYENPRWSQVPEPGTGIFAARAPGASMYYDDDDDDEMDEDEQQEFFRYMFFEMFTGGYTRSKRRGFRSQRHQRYGPSFNSYNYPFSHSSSRASSYTDVSSTRETHTAKQRAEKEKYEQRMRDFEAELEKEEREAKQRERESKLKAEQRQSAHVEAFELARGGNSSGVRNIVEKHFLDVNAPERVPKQQKKAQSTNFQTLLHIAASRCNEDLVLFLLEKGANTAALNKDNMTAFHQSILAGNVPVVRYFLTRRGKASEGCHPSKAAPDGRTPLQLAIASNSIPTVELLLKDATVHDVERCWGQPTLSAAMKAVLETKKGFVPCASSGSGPAMSRKAFLKAEAARKVAAQQEEKAKRVAEERARAAENLRRKEERAARRAEEDRVKEEAQRKLEEEGRIKEALRKLEEEERQKVEEARRVAELAELEAHRKAEEEEALLREKETTRPRAEEEKRQREEHEARARTEAERLRKADQGCRKAEQAAREQDADRRKAEQKKRRKELEMKDCQTLEEQEAEQQREKERQREAEARQRDAEDAEERQRIERELRARVAHEARVAEETTHRVEFRERKPAATAAAVRKRAVQDADAKRAETLRRLQAQAEEHERLKLQRGPAASQTIVLQSPVSPSAPVDPEQEEIMRKRAEQSARDKARHQRTKKERARLENVMRAEQGLDPLPVVNDAQKKRRPRVKKTEKASDVAHHPSYPLTPSSISSSPVSWSPEPSHAASAMRATLLSPPMTPEDLQTCAIPDDLFIYEMPKKTEPPNNHHSPASSSPRYSRGSAQGITRGRGSRGHGRGRGGYSSWRANSTPGMSEADRELAQKNLEIERLSAELAAFRAGVP